MNERDVDEVADITLYRTLALFTDTPVSGRLVRTLTAAMERFSVPDAHAVLANYLYVEPLSNVPPGFDPWGFVVKPSALVVIPDYEYLRVLRESRDALDYVENVLRRADMVVPLLYYVETLPHLLKRNRGYVADHLLAKYGVPREATIRAVLESYSTNPPTIHDMAHDVALRLYADGYIADSQFDQVEHDIRQLAYRMVEKGMYTAPRLAAISLYEKGRYVAGGCDAAEAVYHLLPERDQRVVKRLCPSTWEQVAERLSIHRERKRGMLHA